MSRIGFLLVVLLALATSALPVCARDQPPARGKEIILAELPKEGRDTLALIKRGGPFPYSRDGIVFGNFEKRLPVKKRGYYHEFTVPTPHSRDRGARRIISGNAGEYYYTDDHYQTFRRIRE